MFQQFYNTALVNDIKRKSKLLEKSLKIISIELLPILVLCEGLVF
jgi:hypothetical protein